MPKILQIMCSVFRIICWCSWEWYSLFSDVREFASSCEVCMKCKRNFVAKTALLNTLEMTPAVFQVIHTDHKSLPI